MLLTLSKKNQEYMQVTQSVNIFDDTSELGKSVKNQPGRSKPFFNPLSSYVHNTMKARKNQTYANICHEDRLLENELDEIQIIGINNKT